VIEAREADTPELAICWWTEGYGIKNTPLLTTGPDLRLPVARDRRVKRT
jgi:hypothetical protein